MFLQIGYSERGYWFKEFIISNNDWSDLRGQIIRDLLISKQRRTICLVDERIGTYYCLLAVLSKYVEFQK